MIRPRFALFAAALLLAFAIEAQLMRMGLTSRMDVIGLEFGRKAGSQGFAGAPWLITLLIAITTLGGSLVRPAATILGALALFARGRRRDAVLLAGAIIAGAIALPLLKLLFGRARPAEIWWLVQESHPSFPSGHAMGSMILYPLIGLMIGGRPRWVIAGVALALLIGATRILLGVHWTSDVIGGWLIGGVFALGAVAPRERRSG